MKTRIALFSIAFSLIFSTLSFAAQKSTSKNLSVVKMEKKTKYRVAISFISIGAGIDNESYEKIESFIKSHPKKLKYGVIQKGREGEKTIYLKLGELSGDERKTFVAEINKLIVKKELVKVNESDKVLKISSKS